MGCKAMWEMNIGHESSGDFILFPFTCAKFRGKLCSFFFFFLLLSAVYWGCVCCAYVCICVCAVANFWYSDNIVLLDYRRANHLLDFPSLACFGSCDLLQAHFGLWNIQVQVHPVHQMSREKTWISTPLNHLVSPFS